MKMDEEIKEQIRFVLEDCNEGMRTGIQRHSDLDAESKQMSWDLIEKHEQILAKLERGEGLSQKDMVLVRDANRIHRNDEQNLYGRHKEARALEEWLDQRIELSMEQAMWILEEWLDRDSPVPARVYRALHTLWEEATPNGAGQERAFDDQGKCLKCGSRVSFADETGTVVVVGDEIVGRYDGDITNRNCVRCAYPDLYPDYAGCDQGAE
jgi:hypothetical protein